MEEFNRNYQSFMKSMVNVIMALNTLLSVIVLLIFWLKGVQNLKYMLLFFEAFSKVLLYSIVALVVVFIIIHFINRTDKKY